jgi:hypothetical protein
LGRTLRRLREGIALSLVVLLSLEVALVLTLDGRRRRAEAAAEALGARARARAEQDREGTSALVVLREFANAKAGLDPAFVVAVKDMHVTGRRGDASYFNVEAATEAAGVELERQLARSPVCDGFVKRMVADPRHEGRFRFDVVLTLKTRERGS